MKLEVYNTYAVIGSNDLMHFDVLLPQGSASDEVEHYALTWLKSIGVQAGHVRLDSCSLCHVEEATPEYREQISRQGYAILQMEGCPAPIF